MDHENTNFNYLQRSRQTNLDNNENSYIYWNKIIEKTYGVFNKNFPLEEKLIKNIHTFGNPFYIYYLNNCDFSFLGPSYLEIQDYDKIFEGVSKDIDNILDKQNSLLQKIFTSSITLNNFKSICENIMERNKNTLDLVSRAYDHMMFSYNHSNSKIQYSNEFNELLDKIFDQKMNNKNIPDINSTIKNFIGDYNHQVEDLNKKTTTCFIALEEMCHIFKENHFIINEIIDKPPIDSNSNGNPWLCQEYRKQLDIFHKNWNGNQILDNNIPIIRVLNLPEEIKIKNYDELRGHASFKDYNSSNYIKKNIYDFCRKRPYEPLTSGFKFRDNSITYTPNVYIHGDNSDNDY
jgi:hypothetical protein